MGLITKEIEVKVNSRTIKYYESLGYKIPMKRASKVSYKKHKKEFVYDFDKSFTVKVEDLSDGSNEKVEVLCDYCKNNIMFVPYHRYIKSIEKTGCYVCKDCLEEKVKHVIREKYGVTNVGQLEQVREKMKKTNMERYGVPYYSQTEECKEKMKITTIQRYGAEYYSQTQDYKEKFHNTCVERYGKSYRQIFFEKAMETFHDKTGYHFVTQSPTVKEKIKQSCLDRYGYEYSLQSPEVREKITQTLYKNSSQKASKQQRYINTLYNGILNFPIKYYNVDIYLPSDNLIVEYDGSGHMLNVVTGRESIEEYKQKEIVRNSIIKREGYKQIKIISNDDMIPSDEILLEILDFSRNYFSQHLEHSWIEFNISNSTMRNAENKDTDGVFFDYGILRKIKESA